MLDVVDSILAGGDIDLLVASAHELCSGLINTVSTIQVYDSPENQRGKPTA